MGDAHLGGPCSHAGEYGGDVECLPLDFGVLQRRLADPDPATLVRLVLKLASTGEKVRLKATSTRIFARSMSEQLVIAFYFGKPPLLPPSPPSLFACLYQSTWSCFTRSLAHPGRKCSS